MGHPQPDPEVAAAIGQDTLDKVEGMEYSATAQVYNRLTITCTTYCSTVKNTHVSVVGFLIENARYQLKELSVCKHSQTLVYTRTYSNQRL